MSQDMCAISIETYVVRSDTILSASFRCAGRRRSRTDPRTVSIPVPPGFRAGPARVPHHAFAAAVASQAPLSVQITLSSTPHGDEALTGTCQVPLSCFVLAGVQRERALAQRTRLWDPIGHRERDSRRARGGGYRLGWTAAGRLPPLVSEGTKIDATQRPDIGSR